MRLVIVFYFLSIYSLYVFQASSAHHQESSPLHLQPPVFCVAASLWLSSTRFRRFPAHDQEPSDYSGSLWFYLRIVVSVVLSTHAV
jgi:hypothetical protein